MMASRGSAGSMTTFSSGRCRRRHSVTSVAARMKPARRRQSARVSRAGRVCATQEDGAGAAVDGNEGQKPEWKGTMRQAMLEVALQGLPPRFGRVQRGSVLELNIGGELAEVEPTPSLLSLQAPRAVTLPKLLRALDTAAKDPRIAGVFIQVKPLACGWAKLEELRRSIKRVKDSGKFTVAYAELASMKEYYVMSCCEEIYVPPAAYMSLRGVAVSGSFLRGVLEKVGVEPQVQRIGKYKSAGDQIGRKDMSDAQREVLGTILEDVTENFITKVAIDRGKTPDEVSAFLDRGEFVVDKLVESGIVTGAKYFDELMTSFCKRTGGRSDAVLKVSLKQYLRTPSSLFRSRPAAPASGGKPGKPGVIAMLRTSGAISRGSGGSGIQSDDFVKEVRKLRKLKAVKAVVLRVDSPGGDALASDLMWRELKLLCEKKPVIASMSDVAASGGYYMSMACDKIVAEELTLTGSIGVVTAKFNLKDLYEKVGFTKETISRGKFAELDADERGFTEEEEQYFQSSAQYAYESFRNKAALSRQMSADAMEAVAQGRVWSGRRALEKGLVDALGGLQTAVELAKEQAGMRDVDPVLLLEVSKPKSPFAAMRAQGATALAGLGNLVDVSEQLRNLAGSTQGAMYIMDDIDM